MERASPVGNSLCSDAQCGRRVAARRTRLNTRTLYCDTGTAGPEGPAVPSCGCGCSGVVLAEDRAEPLGSRLVIVRRGGRLGGAVERLELLGEVALQAGAVLTLERAQVLDLAAELVALLLEVTEHLLA